MVLWNLFKKAKIIIDKGRPLVILLTMRKAEVRTSPCDLGCLAQYVKSSRDIMCGLHIKSAGFSLKIKRKIIAKKDLFINDVRVREVRLVGLVEQLGIKPLSEAQAIADDANVDLVLIQPQATPPVAKIMDYGKFIQI